MVQFSRDQTSAEIPMGPPVVASLTLLQRLKQGSHAFPELLGARPVLQVLGSFLNLGSIKDLFLNAE